MMRQSTPGQRFGRFPGVSMVIALAGIAAVAALLYYPRHWRVSPSLRRKPLRRPLLIPCRLRVLRVPRAWFRWMCFAARPLPR